MTTPQTPGPRLWPLQICSGIVRQYSSTVAHSGCSAIQDTQEKKGDTGKAGICRCCCRWLLTVLSHSSTVRGQNEGTGCTQAPHYIFMPSLFRRVRFFSMPLLGLVLPLLPPLLLPLLPPLLLRTLETACMRKMRSSSADIGSALSSSSKLPHRSDVSEDRPAISHSPTQRVVEDERE